MADKLTIKIDGKEFELVPHTFHGREECYVLKPIKREPREFWCVYNHNLQTHQMYQKRENAERCVQAKPLDCDAPFLVREVVE